MPTFANVSIPPVQSGAPYCTSRLMPAAEADLWDRTDLGQDPVPLIYGAAVSVAVRLATQGIVTSNSTYIVLQTDLGTDRWFDVAWIVTTFISGTADFWLCGGVAGANAFQALRAEGTVPSGHGS